MHRRPAMLLLAVCVGLACHGCGPSTNRLPIRGEVSYQGKPIEQGHITFLATQGPPGPVCGAVIRGGRFDIPSEQGLAPGIYRVEISSRGGIAPQTVEEIAAGASPSARELLPTKYNGETTLTVEITPTGPNQLRWELE